MSFLDKSIQEILGIYFLQWPEPCWVDSEGTIHWQEELFCPSEDLLAWDIVKKWMLTNHTREDNALMRRLHQVYSSLFPQGPELQNYAKAFIATHPLDNLPS